MRINFIRHGETEGNRLKRYIGKTDEPLCSEGVEQLGKRIYPDCTVLILSPMKRCLQTAEIIYPSMKAASVCSDLRECDFGRFENKNYKELSGDEDYQRWIDSGGTIPFPDGESPDEFRSRCVSAFEEIVKWFNDSDTVSFIVHGGTIMSVMEKYAVPKRSYYDFGIKNAECLVTEFDGTKITILEKI